MPFEYFNCPIAIFPFYLHSLTSMHMLQEGERESFGSKDPFEREWWSRISTNPHSPGVFEGPFHWYKNCVSSHFVVVSFW